MSLTPYTVSPLDGAALDQLATTIHDATERGRQGLLDAVESYFTIGHALVEARSIHNTDQGFGSWCRLQEFGFSQQWAHILRSCALHEPEVRAAVTTQVVTGGVPNIKAALKTIKANENRAIEQAARATTLDAHAVDGSGDNWRMLAGDFRDKLMELPAGCVDLIVTDPPYPAEFLDLYGDLARVAKHLLADDGIMLVVTGQIFLPRVMELLGEHMTYAWTYCQPLFGANSRIMGRHIFQSWKPWLAYTKGTWPSGRIGFHVDMLDLGYRMKGQYRWQQDGAPSKMLIDALCPEGGTVCDPFTGTGAYGVAAIEMGRQFIGAELDSRRFDMATEALGAARPTPATDVIETTAT